MDSMIARYIVRTRQQQLWNEAANERLAREARKDRGAQAAPRRGAEAARTPLRPGFLVLAQHHS